jgi:dienelactone hydrolase
MNKLCKCWFVFGVLGLASGGCSASGNIDVPISTAGSSAVIGVSGMVAPPVAGIAVAVSGSGGSATSGTAGPAIAGTGPKPPVAGVIGVSGTGAAGATGGAGGMITMAGGGGAAGATAGLGGAAATAGAGGAAGMMGMQSLPPVTDYTKAGPFKTTMTANTGPGNNYTIFRPDPLGDKGFMHSPIIFGPGIATTASFYSAVLTHLASHGFVTICVNSMSGGPGDPGNLKAMTDGLDWIIAQNSQAGVFQGKLAVDRAIAMGYSIGATASVELSSHKAIMTTVVIHGHNTKGDPHGPVLMMTGTMDVIDDMRKTLATLEEAPAVLVALPIGHLDVLTELALLTQISASARYIGPITAWLRYWVNGDQAAKSFFWGADCKMCSSPWITPEPNAKWTAQML